MPPVCGVQTAASQEGIEREYFIRRISFFIGKYQTMNVVIDMQKYCIPA